MATATRRRGQVPQPAAPPQDDAKAKAAEAKAAREAAEQEWKDLIAEATSADGKYEAGSDQIKDAILLELEAADVGDRINAKREYLRLMNRNKALSEAQQEFVETLFPLKKRGDHREEEDVEATRKFRLVIRKLNAEDYQVDES